MAATRDFLLYFGKIIFCCCIFNQGFGDKVAEKIYKDIKAIHPCFTLTNATNQIGCTSSMKGEVGVLHYISSDDDISWIIDKGPHSPYMPIFPDHLFTDDRIDKLTKSGKINGALVLHDGVHGVLPEEYSPDESCPKDSFGAYSNDDNIYSGCSKVKWNPNGTSMLFRKFGFPVFLVHGKSDGTDLVECYENHNKPLNGSPPEYPLCSAQLKDFNFAAKNTPTCIRKGSIPGPAQNLFCDPLSSFNVWSPLFPITHIPPPQDIVMVTAQLDSKDIFNIGLGADNDATGVISLLAIAQAFGQLKREKKLQEHEMNKKILFVFFNGEAWDYIGSSRMVYDMEKSKFTTSNEKVKIKLENIYMFIELKQVGLRDSDSLWVHSDPISLQENDVKTKVQTILNDLESNGKKHGALMGNPSPGFDKPLPPSSFQRFLRVNRSIPGVVITDHKASFTNKFYNSRFDDALNIKANMSIVNNSELIVGVQAQLLANVSTVIANTLLKLSSNSAEEIKVDPALIAQMFFCFFKTANCPLFKEALSENYHDELSTQPYTRYISIQQLPYTVMVEQLLGYFTGYWDYTSQKACENAKENKNKNFNFKWVRGSNHSISGICVNSTVQISKAESPAFDLEQYDSTEYSTWAESRWNDDIGVRIFLVSHPRKQILTLVSGIIIACFSFALVFLIERRTQVLFAVSNSLNDASS